MMNSKILLPLVIIGLLGASGFYLLMGKSMPTRPLTMDAKNTSYLIEGVAVTLKDGKSEVEAAPGSASKITTTLFGEPTVGDLNGDGVSDSAVILVQNTGGSGTFYYVAAALQTTEGVKGTNAILLGDRIAPQTLEINGTEIIANYADRNLGEPMTANPSVGVSKYLKVNGMQLEEVQSGEGSTGDNATTTPSTITKDMSGKTLYYNLGDRFTLALGEEQWNITISDPTIISRVKNIATIKGSQGVYTADKAGKTTLSAEGRPVCAAGEACAQYIINFSVQIVVLGKSTAVPAGTAGDTGICTADAKMCPDGSYVGRVPPKCDFSACPAASGSGISGQALVGPTCPVEQYPPSDQCAPKPFVGTLAILKAGTQTQIKTVTTDAKGNFSVGVSAGDYDIQNVKGSSSLPRCSSEQSIHVVSRKYTTVSISCDSGIR